MPLTRIKSSAIATDSISSARIIDGTIAAVDMSDGSVTTAKIADGAVTQAKIDSGVSLGGGATGGGSDEVFYENDQTVTTNYTITSSSNAMTAGPITVNTGVTVTVPTGSRWVVV